jgi:hypothetical protein
MAKMITMCIEMVPRWPHIHMAQNDHYCYAIATATYIFIDIYIYIYIYTCIEFQHVTKQFGSSLEVMSTKLRQLR